MSKWQTMETAPDYKLVLLWVPPFGLMQGIRSGKFGTWMVGAPPLIGEDLAPGYEPIYWMPQPDGPTDNKD